MEHSYNIPVVTAGEAIDLLAGLYETACDGGTLPVIPSVALWGSLGVGKSTVARELAARLSVKTGKEVPVTDIRLLNFTPVDLRGIPASDAEKKFAVWLRPKILDLPQDGVSILFLDEISAAPQSLQAAAYQIALDKQIGEHKLPQNCIVLCAGNRTTDKSVAFRMPKALANRLLHLEIRADFESWYDWAVEHRIDERVIGYLAFDNRKLNLEPELEELAFPTPRSWEFASRLLKTTGKDPEELHALLAGCIGVSNAVEFEAWCRIYRHLPSVDEILSGKHTVQVKKTDVMYALISSLLSGIAQRAEEITGTELENASRYAARFPADFSSLFFRGLLKIDSIRLKLTQAPSFLEWMKKNKRFL